jgi:glyoxylase-like metal-dependent hydrolase (beta-lactamase superfamily II)
VTNLFERLDHGISVVDTGFVRPQFDASFLLVENGRAAFIETGINHGVPRLLEALAAHGLDRDAVDYVIPTHVHLDHAGGAGLLMRELPLAKLVVHPRGAKHLVDPSVLLEGARAVYGAEVVARDYGELVPIAADRVMTTTDGMVLEVGGRPLRFADTPGHARHHNCIWDEATRGWFTGDTFGIVYPDLQPPVGSYILPATAPVHFDQGAMHATVARLLAQKPDVMYLTHYGAVHDAEPLAVQFLRQIDAMVDAARRLAEAPDRHNALKQAFADIYVAELRLSGSAESEEWLRELLAVDVELNAQGLGVWLDRN